MRKMRKMKIPNQPLIFYKKNPMFFIKNYFEESFEFEEFDQE